MVDDFNMEGGKIRVSNEDFVGDDLKSNVKIDEIRVSAREGVEGDVLGDYHVNGDSKEVDGIRVSSAIDEIDRCGGIVVMGDDSECGYVDVGENEKVKPETLEISGVEKSGEVENGENEKVKLETLETSGAEKSNLERSFVDLGKNEMVKPETLETSVTEKSREVDKRKNDKGKSKVSMSGKKGKSKLSSSDDFGGEGDGDSERRRKNADGEKSRDLGALVRKNFSGINVDESVMRSVSAKVMGSEFEMGDMVWGKVKSHPWWPGHLYNEGFASSQVRRSRRDGDILVAFFGDSSYGWFDAEDLVPYDPNYADKFQQTTLRNFVKAVDESVDESSRRSALGLSCYCRNPFNFRPTEVPGYLAVDIPDFEPGSIYSVRQIQKARDSFRPMETLSFIHQMATSSMGTDVRNLDVIKNKAISLAYRRSRYEEFDETYAEAFGHKPERPQLPKTSTVKEPSRAPLSGPLVFADTVGGRKSSTKTTKPKTQSKKDKYLFKRRDESNDRRTSTQGHGSPSTSSAYEDETSNSATDGYVFQKRDQAVSDNELGESPVTDQLAASASAVTSEDARTGTADTGDVRRASDKSGSDADNRATSGTPLKKKKKAVKRPASEMSSGKPELQEKKVKKLKKAGDFRSSERSERHAAISGENSSEAGRPTQAVTLIREKTQVTQSKMDVDLTNSVPQEVDWVNEVDVRQTLADLHDLAANPSHGMERNVPAMTLQVLLKFRSLVYLKATVTESEHSEAQGAKPLGPDAADKTGSSSKQPKGPSRQDDPTTKVGRKRVPSERQEENAAKRAKKITDVKSLTTEKRVQMKNPELQQTEGKSKVSSTKPMKGEQHGKKAERPPRVQEPTYLVMKYQAGSTLPSHAELKARFTRFGPLDTSLSRVFYKTDTCRVAFLYKQDAHVAYRYAVGSKSLFSNVRFMLKPVAGPEPQQPVNGDPRLNPDPSIVESRPPALAVLPSPAQPLKSCLKKPSGGDEPGVPNNGGGGLRTPRVRFNVGEEKGSQVKLTESRNPVFASKEGALSSSSSTSIAVDNINNQRLSSLHPLQPPLLPLPQFVRPPINDQFNNLSEITPKDIKRPTLAPTTTTTTITTSFPGVSKTLPPPPPPPPAPPSVDISQQMMSLLTRCHDVVTNVKSTFGYIPYHPL